MINTKRIYTLATVNGITHKEVKEYIWKELGLGSTKDLDEQQYKSLITYLDKEPKNNNQSQTNTEGKMAYALNKVQIIGNLGKDPELKYTPSGVAVASFSIATTESWKDKDGNAQERTEWHNIVAWKKLAEICGEYLKKGKKVYVEGKLQTDKYDKDGQTHYTTKIVVDNLIMLDGKGEAVTEKSKPETKKDNVQEAVVVDDDPLPF